MQQSLLSRVHSQCHIAEDGTLSLEGLDASKGDRERIVILGSGWVAYQAKKAKEEKARDGKSRTISLLLQWDATAKPSARST